MNVLGVQFDSKLQWACQVAQAIQKARKAVHAIRLIWRYFNTNELTNLITSHYYSILYYNCEIWLILPLRLDLNKKLPAASSTALKLCGKHDWTTSYERLHKLHKRGTSAEKMKNKHALEL